MSRAEAPPSPRPGDDSRGDQNGGDQDGGDQDGRQGDSDDEQVAGPGADGAQPPDPRRWRVLAVTLVVGFMSLLDVTIVNVAIPSMREGLDTSAATVQWVVSGYALAFGLTLVTGGRLGDAWGRRRLMLLGLTGFVLASAAAGLAPTIELLIAARLLQGAAAGLLTPQSSGLIQTLFQGAERGTAFGLFGLTVSLSSAVGPVLGGLIIAGAGEQDGWRWIFLVNLPIGALALVAVARLIPRPSRTRRGDARLDPLGSLLLGATVLCVLLPLVSVEGGARLPLLLLLLAPLTGIGFVRWEQRVVRRGGTPLLDLGLLRRVPGYGDGLLVGALYFTGFTGVLLVLSVYLQDGLGLSPLAAGLLLTPFAVGSAVSSPLAGRIVTTAGRPTTVVAVLVMMSGLLLLFLGAPAERDARLWLVLAAPLLLAGLGGGGVISPNFTLTLACVPPRMGGAAGGALQTGQRIGSALGAALLMTVYQVAGAESDPRAALRAALVAALVVLSLSLLAALRAWRRSRAVTSGRGGPAATRTGPDRRRPSSNTRPTGVSR